MRFLYPLLAFCFYTTLCLGMTCDECTSKIYNSVCNDNCMNIEKDLISSCYEAKMCMISKNSCCSDLYKCFNCYLAECSYLGYC